MFQDVWIRAINHWDSYDANRSLENWLFTIATNLYRDRYRKAKRWLGRVKQYFNPELQQRSGRWRIFQGLRMNLKTC
ncbi:hypothetical protein M5W83_24405 [Paenibacillus thiaminolyticus]|uniref:RNA polymerase sigma-70 region 2 domain-containing protein n=1 Tax=Paenibacillus thiaminolyticus TaxID=49283 RepID=A0AAP9DX09_PANTH|nr:sigma factor [Paenibacillus thiaminolyticus]MCY9533985.1 hypothetical protein [Paenibacillus thiaminolyticus]MCY9603786.1 hypothetical protein [Paenibacillus thiaminolyticus]MCY9610295.1 hypothetical protein [Paenibacillus thiaminolyticus]MCY9614503.1 hypothetical protein [Paenibacillus thiaminolyticus]MCY9618968.1 hypothetical protein [Paenibacillus thiaminolyticus]